MNQFIYVTSRVHKNLIRCYSSSIATCQDLNLSEQPRIRFKHLETIHDFIGGNPDRIKNSLASYIKLQLLDDKVVRDKLYVIQSMKLADQSSLRIIQLLNYTSVILRNRHKVLQECGIIPYKISSKYIKRCLGICRSSVSKLKKKEYIHKDEKVLQNLWLAAGLDLNFCPPESDKRTVQDLKIIALEGFLKLKIGLPDDEYATYGELMIFRLKNRSFETINTNYHIFRNIIGLSKRRIQTNWFILHYDPFNVMDLLNRVQNVANVDMKIILHIHPKIAAMPSENLDKIIEYLEAENIPLHFVQRRFDIFTLNCETVLQRIRELKKEEYFLINLKNPRIIDLIYYQVKAKRRMDILEEINVQPTIGCLSLASDETFESFCLKGGKHYNYDTLPYISSELNIIKKDFISKIRRHNRWCLVPLVHVGRNLQKLRQSFSDEEITKYIYILFYYSDKLNRALADLDAYKGFEDFKENGRIKKDYVLPLALYILEKESNFTGNSIWDQEDVNPYEDLPDFLVKTHKSKSK